MTDTDRIILDKVSCGCDSSQTETVQSHTHEFLGSTKLAEEGEDRHNHRFAGVTSEMVLVPGGHVHDFLVNTDFFDHHHEVGGRTCLQIDVGEGKHVHFAKGNSTFVDDHCHVFQFATLIDSPLLPAEECP
ncbi:MAG: YmaF family protein [Pelotomaculum sp. PtaB.Bin104]|nr:MAG: YmaF family protein [Pelotomaculum sp. PtaB.Bin104]